LKILATGDWHLTDQQVKARIDDYSNTQRGKIDFIFDLVEEEGIEAIIQPGDFCDQFISPDKFKTRWIRILRDAPLICCVYGQHDCRYHTSNIDNTPFGVLKEAIGLKLMTDKPYYLSGEKVDLTGISKKKHGPPVAIYGASWGKEVPRIITPNHFNVLATHRMIVFDKLWAQQEDYEMSGTFLRRNKFDLVVSGDNHTSFYMTHKDRWLINCGSLMRNKIDQGNHLPHVWVFDTSKRTAEKIMIPIRPFSKVMSVEKAGKEKAENLKLKALSDLLKKKSKIKGLEYKDRIFRRIKKLKEAGELKPRTERILEEVMEDG